jgi:ABC-type hemin transport system ATPase subunit
MTVNVKPEIMREVTMRSLGRVTDVSQGYTAYIFTVKEVIQMGRIVIQGRKLGKAVSL